MLSDQDRASSYLDTDPFTRGGAAISQTPAQAMSSKHFIISIIFVSISNWIINFGITALSFLSHDRTGLWRSESFVTIDGHRVYYADAPIVADLGISTFLLVFFVTIATTGGVRKAILQGKTLPIPTQEYRRVLRYLGVTIRNVFLRGAIYALYALAIIYPVTMLIFYAECEGGAMHVFNPPGTDDEHCYMRKWGFIFFKAGWSALVTALVFPLVFLGGVNRDGLSDDEYQKFLYQHDATVGLDTSGIGSYNASDNA